MNRTLPALIAVSLAVFVAALDLTVTAAVLPQLLLDFQVPLPSGLADAAWIVNGYLIAYVVTMPFMGRVSDLYGRRLVFLICLALFVGGSLWAALTTDLWTMVAARVVQALGGGAMVPVALAAVSDAVSVRYRALAVGLITAVDTGGWVAGPTYGAWVTTSLAPAVEPALRPIMNALGMTDPLSWHLVFLLNVPIGIIAAILVATTMPAGEKSQHKLDVVGAALLTLFLLATTIGLYVGAPASPEGGAIFEQAQGPTTSPYTIPLLIGAVLFLVAFFWWERRTPEPLLNLALLRQPAFAAANTVNLLTGIILLAVMVEIPVLLQAVSTTVEGATAASGVLLALFAGGMVLGALVAGPLLRFIPTVAMVLGGLVLLSLGLWQMSGWENTLSPDVLQIPLALAGLGLGFITTPLATTVLERVAEQERGIAASILLVARLLGMTLGLSVLVTWALYRYEELVALADKPALTDPDAVAKMIAIASNVSTTVVTDLFMVTFVIALIAFVPALFLRHGKSA